MAIRTFKDLALKNYCYNEDIGLVCRYTKDGPVPLVWQVKGRGVKYVRLTVGSQRICYTLADLVTRLAPPSPKPRKWAPTNGKVENTNEGKCPDDFFTIMPPNDYILYSVKQHVAHYAKKGTPLSTAWSKLRDQGVILSLNEIRIFDTVSLKTLPLEIRTVTTTKISLYY